MTCTFFGHHDCPEWVKEKLREAIVGQIAGGTKVFYVGNHGHFDAMVLSCLREVKMAYSEITYAVVLAYLPTGNDSYAPDETVLPAGIESVPKRFAIDFRNRWMLDRSGTVISYITHSWGGAAKYVKIAERKGSNVIRLENACPER